MGINIGMWLNVGNVQHGSLSNVFLQRILAIHPENLIAYYDFSGTDNNLVDYKDNVSATLVNPTLQEPGIGDGKKSTKFNLSGSYGTFNAAELDAVMNKNEFTILMWVKNTKAVWDDSNYHYIFSIINGVDSSITIVKNNNPGDFRTRYNGSGANLYAAANISTDEWVCIVMVVDQTTKEIRNYVNGIHRILVVGSDIGTWGEAGISDARIATRYTTSKSLGWTGNIGPTAIFNEVLSNTDIALLSSYKPVKGVLFIGDSKTKAESWRPVLCDLLSNEKNVRYTEIPERIGIDGIGTQGMRDRCDADIAAMAGVQAPVEISIALGANDASGGVLAADWNTNMRYILNAYHTAFPLANIRLSKPWRSTYTDVMVEIGTLIDAIYADYTWLKPGIDEFDILPGDDNGATYTTDGVHPNAAGGALIAEALFNVMK